MLICVHTVYSVFQSTTLAYTIQKLLASTYIDPYVLIVIQCLHIPANSHRLFVISETPGSASPSPTPPANPSATSPFPVMRKRSACPSARTRVVLPLHRRASHSFSA